MPRFGSVRCHNVRLYNPDHDPTSTSGRDQADVLHQMITALDPEMKGAVRVQLPVPNQTRTGEESA